MVLLLWLASLEVVTPAKSPGTVCHHSLVVIIPCLLV